jgi:hypothetical protein
MSKLITIPNVTIEKDDTIQHPLGILDRQISGQDLINEPDKYVKLYPTFYKNKEQIQHESNTRFNKGHKSVGSENRLLVKKANNGIEFALITSTGKKKDNKTKDLQMFEMIVAERKKKAQEELKLMKAKQNEKIEATSELDENSELDEKRTRKRVVKAK